MKTYKAHKSIKVLLKTKQNTYVHKPTLKFRPKLRRNPEHGKEIQYK